MMGARPISTVRDGEGSPIFPSGPSLGAGQKKLRVYSWGDWGSSNDTTGVRDFAVGVENFDSVDHQVCLAATLYAIKTTTA